MCLECQLVACCPAHLPLHRPRDSCLPVTVQEREGKGRVIVAARDIKPFEVVLVDRPAIVGPFDDARPQCVECYAEWEGGYSCEQCTLPLCGPGCAEGNTAAAVLYTVATGQARHTGRSARCCARRSPGWR